MLILGLAEANTLVKEKSSKQGTVGLSGPSGVKIIFALLAKVIAVYV